MCKASSHPYAIRKPGDGTLRYRICARGALRYIQPVIVVHERMGALPRLPSRTGKYGQIDPAKRAMADIVVTEADLDREVVARAGDALVLQLPENPTTGFRWAFASPANNILELERDEFQTTAHTGVGSGGLRVLRFTAKRAGSVRIELKLSRSWESSPPK